MSRRTFMTMLGVSMVGTALAACAPQAQPTVAAKTAAPAAAVAKATQAPAAPQKAAAGPVKMTASAWAIAGYTELQGESFQKYAKEHPGVEIEWLQLPSADYYTKLSVLLAANSAPEISLYTPERYLDYAARGGVRNLGPLIEKDKYDLSDFYPILVEMCKWREKIGGLPAYCSPIVCYYNKTIFKEAGAEFPSEKWTWEDLRQAAIKTTKADKGVWGFGLERQMWGPIIWSNGGDFWNKDLTASTMDDKIVIDGLQWWGDLRNVDKCAPTLAQMSDMKTEMLFQTGKLAMVYHPLSRSIQIVAAKPPFDWELGWAPKGSQGRKLRLGAGVWTISKDCKPAVLDTAWDAVKFIAGAEEQKVWAGKHVNVPGRKSVAESPAFVDTPPPAGLDVNLKMMPYMMSPHGMPGYTEWWDKLISDAVALVESGKKASEVCPDVKKKLDQWLKDNPKDKWIDLV